MEYIDGLNLYEIIKQEGAYSIQKAIHILKQMLSAIGHAHKAKIIHRDIKPNNVMINEEGIVKITDFGLAKDQTSMIHTMSMAGGGTLFYMSPEHVKGFSFTDRRSDIYSTGMTFYEMITGNVPFGNMNSDFDIREMIVRKDFKKPAEFDPNIPAALEAIVMKSIAKEPDDRYQTAEEMLNAIQEFERKHGILENDDIVVQKPKVKTDHIRKKTKKIEQKKFSDPTFDKDLPIQRKHSKLKVWLPIAILLPILFIVVFYSMDYFSLLSIEKPVNDISSLTISSSPENAIIYILGDSIGVTPLNRYSLQAGNYSLLISNENYKKIDTTFLLQAGTNLDLAFNLKPKKEVQEPVLSEKKAPSKTVIKSPAFASLSVQSNPPNAEIWLNGKRKGFTPTSLRKLSSGSYKLKLHKEGYEEYIKQFKLGKENKVVEATLSLFTGRLMITTVPQTVQIMVNSKIISNGQTPVELNNIPVGIQNLEISRSGYASYIEKVEIKHNEIQTINAELKEIKGKLSIKVIPWGSIYINNQIQKATSDIKFEAILAVDQYLIKIVHPTLGKWQKNVQIKTDEETKISVNFNKSVSINVSSFDEAGNPIAANIFVDNKSTGQTTPIVIKVRTGMHSFIVKKDGYISVEGERELVVDKDSIEPQKFILKKIN